MMLRGVTIYRDTIYLNTKMQQLWIVHAKQKLLCKKIKFTEF